MTTWGIVATVKAPIRDILDFAAHHLDLGAHRVHIYLDDDNIAAYNALKPHPKIRVTLCDAPYWQRQTKTRPAKHQVRQTANMMQAYRKRADTDWLAHIDVDEFLWPDTPINDQLSALPPQCLTARLRPLEALAGGENGITHFKACRTTPLERQEDSTALYPEYGQHLNGGFLSHVMGKVFVRTGIDGLKIRIHHAFLDDETNPGQQELSQTALCHLHAKSWPDWLATYRYRHENGSYRAELKPATAKGVLNLHALFTEIEEKYGVEGLQHFYNEVCLATPDHLSRLDQRGLLRSVSLDLATKTARHFPDHVG